MILALSPFRLGEEPNIRVGVAMITSAPGGAGAAREDGAGAVGQRAQRPGRRALHAGNDGEIIRPRESGGYSDIR